MFAFVRLPLVAIKAYCALMSSGSETKGMSFSGRKTFDLSDAADAVTTIAARARGM